MLAALNHPNICAIYGFEEADGIRLLILELVEGETLARDAARRLERAGARPEDLPLERALDIARQIADALEAAHDKGIVHRDLKPANIKITPDGAVKVLDFGLAKAVSGDGSVARSDATSPTTRADATGAVIGTAAYMSPEQARGQRVDKRTDIWAFGCVLYEMLTGRVRSPATRSQTRSPGSSSASRTGRRCRRQRRRRFDGCCSAASRRIPTSGCEISATSGSRSTRSTRSCPVRDRRSARLR